MEEVLEQWSVVKHALAVRKSNCKLTVQQKDVSATLLWISSVMRDHGHIEFIAKALSCIVVSTADCERGFLF